MFRCTMKGKKMNIDNSENDTVVLCKYIWLVQKKYELCDGKS